MEEERYVNPNMKVLIVDDFPSMRKIVRQLMAKLGVQDVETAPDGRVALTKMRRNSYDLILLDWNMPELSGLEVLKFMKGDPSLSDIPVILITAESKKENIVAAAKAGVKEYIVKPFDADTLKDKILKVFDMEKKAPNGT